MNLFQLFLSSYIRSLDYGIFYSIFYYGFLFVFAFIMFFMICMEGDVLFSIWESILDLFDKNSLKDKIENIKVYIKSLDIIKVVIYGIGLFIVIFGIFGLMLNSRLTYADRTGYENIREIYDEEEYINAIENKDTLFFANGFGTSLGAITIEELDGKYSYIMRYKQVYTKNDNGDYLWKKKDMQYVSANELLFMNYPISKDVIHKGLNSDNVSMFSLNENTVKAQYISAIEKVSDEVSYFYKDSRTRYYYKVLQKDFGGTMLVSFNEKEDEQFEFFPNMNIEESIAVKKEELKCKIFDFSLLAIVYFIVSYIIIIEFFCKKKVKVKEKAVPSNGRKERY